MPDARQLLAHMDRSVPSVIDLYMPPQTDFFDRLKHESHKKPQVMWFHAKWCGHCVRMTDAWESARSDGRADWHPIDCSEDRAPAAKMGVSSFPTILKFSKGVLSEHDGARTPESLIQFACSA